MSQSQNFSRKCGHCGKASPDGAVFCMHCGLPLQEPESGQDSGKVRAGFNVLGLTLAISLLISLVLAKIFGLPIFFLAGFLPLFWMRCGK